MSCGGVNLKSTCRAFIALLSLFMTPLFAQEPIRVDEPVFVQPHVRQALTIPTDDLSPSDIENAKTVQIAQVVLGESSELVIPPFQSIVIQQLVAAEGAKIQLAHSDNGGDGAHARFFVKRVSGHIVLESSGDKGRDGRNGRHGRQGRDGERGRNARTLIFGLIWLGDGEDGRPGYPGENGENGEDGEDGGRGGEITLYYNEKADDAKVLVNVSGGDAGRPGAAGLGGLGGNGGAGGRGWKDGSQGPMGSRGINGIAGRPGRPGLPGRAAIYQVPSKLYTCLLQLDAMASADELTEEDFDLCREIDGPITSARPVSRAGVAVQSTNEFEIATEDGVLYVSADGKDGRDAQDAWRPGTSPEPGTSASHGGNLTVFVRDLPLLAVLSSRGGRGGNGANGAPGLRGQDGANGRNGSLFHHAKPGENGTDGGNGGAGSHGGYGGNGGHIRVVYVPSDPNSYDQNWTDRFDLRTEGGEGGRAGHGAVGGRGGLAGRGGKKFWSKNREPDGWPGIDGTAGLDGRDGQRGENGQIEYFEARSISQWIVDEFKAELERQRN